MLMDRRTDGKVGAVRGSKAQQQVLVTQGSSTSTVAGDDGRQDSLGSLSEDPQRIVLT